MKVLKLVAKDCKWTDEYGQTCYGLVNGLEPKNARPLYEHPPQDTKPAQEQSKPVTLERVMEAAKRVGFIQDPIGGLLAPINGKGNIDTERLLALVNEFIQQPQATNLFSNEEKEFAASALGLTSKPEPVSLKRVIEVADKLECASNRMRRLS